MKTTLNTKIILNLAFVLAGPAVLAQTTAQEGLTRIKQNLNNSKTNLTEYQKNLEIVDGNIGEIGKAKDQVDGQKKELNHTITDNTENLKKAETQEGEVHQLIAEEQKQLQLEQQKIQELEKTLATLKQNQTLRNQNLAAYNEQLKQAAKEKGEWKSRSDKLTQTSQGLQNKATTLANQDNEWKGKKKGYQGEITRWKSEVDRNQKLNDNYSTLAEIKE